MDKFNYALYFDREQIFSVDDKESIKEFNKALMMSEALFTEKIKRYK